MTFLDRIKETSTSTGTGAFTLGGAVLGYKVFTNGTYKYCIVNETESEWEVGEGTVASGVLTRTTIEASSNGGSAVSFSAGTKYVFNTVSAAYVNSLVPYTGATANVNLGAYNITATNIIRAGGLATQFLKANGSVDSTTYMNRAVYDTDGNGVVDAAEKMQTIGRNSTGVTLYKGTIVYISGSTGNRPNFVKAQANSEATSAGTFGVVVSDIANNSDGYVATIGTLADLDTRTTATNPFTSVTLADGDTIYLDPNTAGYVTNVKPSAPNHIVYVGKVVRTSPTLGTIVYRIQNGYELNEIHDVSISSVANNDVLVYETATTLWKNKSIATILGYTPANDSLVVHLAGAENITGVKTFQNALQTTTGNNLLNTGGGNTVIGYTADPASSATYKLDVNGQSRFVGNLLSFNGSNLRAGLYTSSGWGMLDLYYGSLAVRLDPSSTSYMCLGGATLSLGTTTGNNSALLYMQSTVQGLRIPNMTTTQKNLIVSPATSLLVYDTDLAAFQYYTGSAWAGLGGGITGSGTAGQLTYWSGTSAVTGSNNLFWDNTNISLGVGSSSFYTPVSGWWGGANQEQKMFLKSTASTKYTSLVIAGGASNSGGGAIQFLNYTGTPIADFGTADGTEIGFAARQNTANINFYTTPSGTTPIKRLSIFSSGNITIQNGGTFTDGGYRFDINGTGATTGALRVTGGNVQFGSSTGLNWDNTNNYLGIGRSPGFSLDVQNAARFFSTIYIASSLESVGPSTSFTINGGSTNANSFTFGVNGSTIPSVNSNMFNVSRTFNPTSGSLTFTNLLLASTINQTGGANGITRGLYINPTLTAAADFRAIETTNGKIIFGNLPTSSAGLPTGALWNNSGVINIV